MAIYRYVKQPPNKIPGSKFQPNYFIATKKIVIPNLLPQFLMAIGMLLIITVASPIIYHELFIYPRLKKASFISPVPGTVNQIMQTTQVAGVTTNQQITKDALKIKNSISSTDFTSATNWFPTAPVTSTSPSKITHYTIDIPSLNIKNAVVEIGGSNLKGSLIQYAGTANPGEYGSSVIFGHSILRQFYNPSEKNPNRYLSIFSTIMTLDLGEKFFINFDGIRYTYQITDKYEVNPDQVEVLQQRYDKQALKLITCTPEGTYLRRGVIEAQLVKA